MDDVKPDVSIADEATVDETTVQEPQPEKETTEDSVAQEAQERMVPISVVQKERKQRQELQRKLAEVEGNQRLQQYDPNDMDNVLAHPFVQELLLKEAKRELTDFARDTLDQYSDIHPAVKKAILANARGFVNENTSDIETAKLDLLDYIESIAEEAQTQSLTQSPTQSKGFQVASTNVSKTSIPGARPADISRILEKPVDKWTPEEIQLVEDYKKNQ